MKCDKCNSNEADINICYLSKNRQKSVSLCESCSDSMGISSHVVSDCDHISSDVERQQFSVNYELHCSFCNTDIGHLLSTGQTGCPHCYSVFKKEIERFFLVKKYFTEESIEYSEPLRDRFNEFIEQ